MDPNQEPDRGVVSYLDNLDLAFGFALDYLDPQMSSTVVLEGPSSRAAQPYHVVVELGTSKDRDPALAYPVRAHPSYRSGRRTLVLYSRVNHRTTEFY